MSTHRSYFQRLVIWLGALDALCLVSAMVAGVVLRLGWSSLEQYVVGSLSGWLYLITGVLGANYVAGSYGFELRLSRFNMVVNWLFSIGVAVLVVSITSYAWFDMLLGRGVLLISLLVYSALWLTLRLVIYYHFFKQESFAYRVAILGTGNRARADLAMLSNARLRPKHSMVALIQLDSRSQTPALFSVESSFSPPASPAGTPPPAPPAQPSSLTAHPSAFPLPPVIRCLPSHLATTVRALACDILLVAVERSDELAGVYPQLRRLKFGGVAVLMPLHVAEIYANKVPLNLVDEQWLVHASHGFISPMTARLKRIMDIVLVLLTSPLAFVLLASVAFLVKVTGWRSPVFYSQQRVGRFGTLFQIHKFRTMRADAEAAGAVWSPHNDPRVTMVGRILRKYRLDEVPQLWNILKGEMSLVGPRPERPELVAKLEKVIPYYRERENIPPGLTGWAQIRYPYGATTEDARIKLEYDLYYLQNFSVSLDLRIILRTVRIVLFGMEREMR